MSNKSKLSMSNFEVLQDSYIGKQMSTREISNESETLFGFFVAPSGIYSAIKRMGIECRSISDGISLANATLDPSCSHLSEKTIEWIDGFLLGDGSIGLVNKNQQSFRFTMGSVKEQWTKYAMDGLYSYHPSMPKQSGKVSKKNPNICWLSNSLTHPDIRQQRSRWYPKNNKCVPKDVRITPTSVMLWYLGDGSICSDIESNYSAVRLATCSFSVEDIEDILIPKLFSNGIESARDKSKNDIRIRTSSIGTFFDFIGHTSPIQCYDYKFDVPSWLYLNRLEDIAKNKKERWRAIYHIKKGNIKCTSSPGGKMFLFNNEQAADLRMLLDGTGR